MAPEDNDFNIPKHARYSSTSQAFESADEDGEQKTTMSRQEQAQFVESEDEEESSTRGCGSDTVFNQAEATAYTTLSTQTSDMLQTPTMEELAQDVVRQCIMTGIAPGGAEIAYCFANALEEPPITPESLTELDMPRIINNPRLRHDVNFDRELHFRPNLDGSKGKEKMMKAEDYWKALEGELFMYGFVQGRMRDSSQPQDEVYWKEVLAGSEKRLPKVFDAIRDILKTLVPDYDQNAVSERLDSEFTMQQIKNGVCDLIDLANWLAKILKNHCAPMRDQMVDRMQAEIKQGAAEEKADTLVNGIRQLLTILEAMKLDVANHQIRHMRPLLVEDTVNFQRRYNAHRISINKIDVVRSRRWLNREMEQMTAKTGTASHLEALTSALLRGILFNEIDDLYPQTFFLDSERIWALRTDLHSSIYHDLCGGILTEVASSCSPKNTELVKAVALLRRSVQAIVGTSGKFADRIENIAAEIMRFVLMLEARDYTSDASLLAFVEDRLVEELRTESPAFENRAQDTFDRLLPKLQASVDQHIKLSALHLQDRLVPPVPLPPMQWFGFGAVCAPVSAIPQADPDDDAVRRLTHMIVLHWQVWADLVYLAAPDEDDIASSGSRTPPSPASTSPTVPVAQAVYAPGRKWLPIGVVVTEVPSGISTPTASPGADSQPPAANREGNDSPSEQSAIDSKKQQQQRA